jgi:hypothetical protein
VHTTELVNTGTIRGGDGMDGAVVPPNNDIINGGNGGAMSVFVQSLINSGEIRAGDGGDLLFPATSGKGGDGGDVLVAAGPPDPGLLLNSGLIAAGNGGAGPGQPQGNGSGGNGGSVKAFAAPQYINDGGELRAGLGGELGGADGSVSVSAAFIWDNGIMTANGIDYAFGTLLKPRVRGVAGSTVLVPITFLNEGLRTDTYILIWSNSQGWKQEFLPSTTQRFNGLRYGIVFAPFTIPVGTAGGTVSQLTLTARSQNSPSLVREESVDVVVVAGGRIWMPRLFQGNGAPGTTPNQGDLIIYLPLIFE